MNNSVMDMRERRIGDLVAEDWHAAGVFQQFGIDFCCGGARSVNDACRAAGVDAAAVVEALDGLPADPPPDAAQWSVDRLLEHIVMAHHAYVRSALPRIAAYLTKLDQVHGARHPELGAIAAEFQAMGADLLQHMLKEEHVLFPYIRELAHKSPRGFSPFGSVENPIRMMEREHEEAGAQLGRIRALSGDYGVPADGCATYRVCFEELAAFEADLHRHVHLENNVLFPRAVQLEASR